MVHTRGREREKYGITFGRKKTARKEKKNDRMKKKLKDLLGSSSPLNEADKLYRKLSHVVDWDSENMDRYIGSGGQPSHDKSGQVYIQSGQVYI